MKISISALGLLILVCGGIQSLFFAIRYPEVRMVEAIGVVLLITVFKVVRQWSLKRAK